MHSILKGRFGIRALVGVAAIAVSASSQADLLHYSLSFNQAITFTSFYLWASGGGGNGTLTSVTPFASSAGSTYDFYQAVSGSSTHATFIARYDNGGGSDGLVIGLEASADTSSFDGLFGAGSETNLTAWLDTPNATNLDNIRALFASTTANFAAVDGPQGKIAQFSVPSGPGTYVVQSVPEPFTMALGLAGAGLAVRRMKGRRRQTAAATA